MSALGHKQTSRDARVTSGLPRIADIRWRSLLVRFCQKRTNQKPSQAHPIGLAKVLLTTVPTAF